MLTAFIFKKEQISAKELSNNTNGW